MRTHGIWIAAALAATLRGLGGAECGPEPVEVVSLNGITTDSALSLDSALVGTWRESGDVECDTSLARAEAGACTCKSLVVRLEPGESYYIMRQQVGCDPSESDTVVSRAEFTRIGRFEYLDLWTEPEPWQLSFIPLHFITRVDRHGDSLIVTRPLSTNWREVLSDAPGIGLLGDDWETVATGTTEEMRQWIEQRFKPAVFATARSTTVPYDRKVYVRAR